MLVLCLHVLNLCECVHVRIRSVKRPLQIVSAAQLPITHGHDLRAVVIFVFIKLSSVLWGYVLFFVFMVDLKSRCVLALFAQLCMRTLTLGAYAIFLLRIYYV